MAPLPPAYDPELRAIRPCWKWAECRENVSDNFPKAQAIKGRHHGAFHLQEPEPQRDLHSTITELTTLEQL
jgi:hypothetical protein